MNSGAFDEAAFDFLVSDEGGANVAADRARSAATFAPPSSDTRKSNAASSKAPEFICDALPKVRA